MTESAEDRSKRVFISHLKSHDWTHQNSVFYQDYLDAQNAIEDSRMLRKAIISKFPKYAFLWRLVLKYKKFELVTNSPHKKMFVMPIHIFFSNNKIKRKEFNAFAREVLDNESVFTYGRSISEYKINAYINRIKKEGPHDLNKYFNYSGKINRFSSPLNKKIFSINGNKSSLEKF